jgi:hypothetical protein
MATFIKVWERKIASKNNDETFRHFLSLKCVLEVHKSMDISKGNFDQN